MSLRSRCGWLGSLIAVGVIASFTLAHAEGSVDSLKVTDPAPEFSGVTDNGKTWRSADHVGKHTVVVYFYPAAMTGGCTKQACGFRDLHSRLTKLGVEVVGISGDRPQNLQYFKLSNRLNFPLMSDTSGAIARAFGVPLGEGGSIQRTVEGKDVTLTRDLTASRWTFVIGRDKKIALIETDVDPAGDAKTVAEAIEKMAAR